MDDHNEAKSQRSVDNEALAHECLDDARRRVSSMAGSDAAMVLVEIARVHAMLAALERP